MSFNAATDPWIPVILQNGTASSLSLIDVYKESENVYDIDGNAAEKSAVMSLLVAITQSALDGPADESEWKACKKHVVPKTVSYLKKNRDLFALYGEHPFLQVPGLSGAPNRKHYNLKLTAASGNNHTLFDPEASQGVRQMSDAELTLSLLAYLKFAPCGLIRATNVRWGKDKVVEKNKQAPASNLMLTFFLGDDLLTSIWLNLSTKAEFKKVPSWGKPVWEDDFQKQSCPRARSATHELMHYLVPLSKAVLLIEGTADAIYADGLPPEDYPVVRDPMATVFTTKSGKKDKEESRCLTIDLSKQIWRDLPYLCAQEVESRGQKYQGPYALKHDLSSLDTVRIYVAGVVYNKAKMLGMAEWSVRIDPNQMLDDRSFAYQTYLSLISGAEKYARTLSEALYVYCSEAKKLHDFKLEKYLPGLRRKAEQSYWSALDGKIVAVLNELSSTDSSADEYDALRKKWLTFYRHALYTSYQQVCSTDTGRSTQAYAKGREYLRNSLNKGGSCA